MKSLLNVLFHAIFWSWNIIFLSAAYLGILPFVGIALIAAMVLGQVPIEFFLTLVALVVVPAVCTWIGARHFSRQPLQLIRLFYCVEAPLFLLCLIRLFLLRELTPASTQILASLGVCILAFLGELLVGYASRNRAIAWMQLGAHTIMLLVGIYAGILLLFYAVPLAAFFVQKLFQFEWLQLVVEGLRALEFFVYVLLFLVLVGLSCSLFVVMPSFMTTLYIHSGRRILRMFAAQYGQRQTFVAAGAIAIAWLTIFIALQQQPQIQAFALLERPVKTDGERQALLAKSEPIRSGLVNAYLSGYRYLSSEEDNNHIKVMYEQVFGVPETVSQSLQNVYNRLMSPFLYNGSALNVEEAATLYAEFFDMPIQKAEQVAVNHALQSTFNQDEAKAGLLNLNQRKVWLRSQQVTIQEHGDWADVELYEVYENQTSEVQEVFYSFSLPESAVITGLWLGDTDDRAKRFPFVVSPRGAAQQVYNQQVRRERPVDPALLEQVGPRHYRLRAFPIPPRSFSDVALSDRRPQRPMEMHLWLTYKVMQQEQGWAMPQLGEKRNLFWTNATQRTRNGQVRQKPLDAWVESFLPASQLSQSALHSANLLDGYRVSAKPLAERDYSLPSNKRFAIVLDSSRSMATHVKELNQTFQWLREQGFANANLADNDADLYITDAAGSAPKRLDDISRFDPAKLTFYGSAQLNEMLQQFDQLRGNTPYDGILLVTDEGSYELSDDSKNLPALSAPLWMVHLGALPPAYDDATLKAIQDSSGGVSTEVPEVLRRLATQAALGSAVVSVVDGYAWMMDKPQPDSQIKTKNRDDFEPLAVRQLILGLSREQDLNQLTQLDAIHAIAKSSHIVTPYSSMLVLVNDEQRAALKQAETQSDRFKREVESGDEQLTKPGNPLNTAVPEPSTWLALAIAAIALLLFKRQYRRKMVCK